MNTTSVLVGLLIGFVLGAIAAYVLASVRSRKSQANHQKQIQRLDSSIIDLRQERTADKETNRWLRHELAANTPESLAAAAESAQQERDEAFQERDRSVDELRLVQADLEQASTRLTDREAKLVEYREALKEIRISLEAQDQGRSAAEPALASIDATESPAAEG